MQLRVNKYTVKVSDDDSEILVHHLMAGNKVSFLVEPDDARDRLSAQRAWTEETASVRKCWSDLPPTEFPAIKTGDVATVCRMFVSCFSSADQAANNELVHVTVCCQGLFVPVFFVVSLVEKFVV